jgi:hypothetical protein
MVFDSSLLIAAALLLGASVFAWRAGPHDYLRFAAILFAALAVAAVLQSGVPGLAPALADAVALIVMPLGGAALGLFAVARFAKPLPPLAATAALAASLCGGIAALVTGDPLAALLPLALAGVAIVFAALYRLAPVAALSGGLLFAGACAFAGDGAGRAALSLFAAGLFGLSAQRLSSSSRAERPAVLS